MSAETFVDLMRRIIILIIIIVSSLHQTVEAAFIHGLDALRKPQVAQCAEVTSELQLIKATVAFGRFAVKSYPGLRVMLNHTTTAFLNRHVGDWVVQQGGWVSRFFLSFQIAVVKAQYKS